MTHRTVTIAAATGLHARPAALFVQAASATGIPLTLAAGQKTANAASILGVISLGVRHGDEVVISTDAPDADAALDRLAELLSSDLDAA